MFPIARSGLGQLSTMARPRGNDWLSEEMSALRVAGVDVLVSMIWSRFQLREGDLLLSMQRELMVEGEQSSLLTGPTVMTGSNLILR
jgi:hypothetical protein